MGNVEPAETPFKIVNPSADTDGGMGTSRWCVLQKMSMSRLSGYCSRKVPGSMLLTRMRTLC